MKYFTLILLFFCCEALAQISDDSTGIFIEKIQLSGPDSVKIDSIIISGNEKTQEFIIRREITFKPGSEINKEIIEYNKNRIYSLGLFTKVEALAYKINKKNVIEFSVSERWYLFPYPIFGIRDRDWSKLYYGMGIAHTNFLGINQKIFGSFALGYDPWANFHYYNPDIVYGSKILLDLSLSYSKVKNKSELINSANKDVYEQWFSGNVSIGKRFGLYKYLWYSLGYANLSVDDKAQKTASGTGKDTYINMMLNGNLDTRDMAEYPMKGENLAFSITKMGLGESQVDYTKLSLDLREYLPTSTILGSICFRAFSIVTFGNFIPYYSHNYYGYAERIRGYFFDKWEGENIFGFSTELRVPIFGPKYLILDDIPFPEFSILRYAVCLNLFYDTGEIWDRYNFKLKELKHGFGGGINFLMPYSIILRLEYAFNQKGKGEIFFDAGVSF
jgi:outer membrane protein assembly factor BamA